MARIEQQPAIMVQMTMLLNESEMRALDALTGYDIEEFLKVFYEKMGQSYLKPHESGLRSLFKAVRTEIPPILERARKARAAFDSPPGITVVA